ncbi:hypothetical protein [Dactylosporangium sp. NPDC048998]|uniref:hypothetical protein n=1 Tax=Dactylosporangium sp. NPDC048998 TaxID=3363976 RepID=UPI003723A686
MPGNKLTAGDATHDKRPSGPEGSSQPAASVSTQRGTIFESNASGTWTTTATKTNHYGNDTDNPTWIAENGGGTITRNSWTSPAGSPPPRPSAAAWWPSSPTCTPTSP